MFSGVIFAFKSARAENKYRHSLTHTQRKIIMKKTTQNENHTTLQLYSDWQICILIRKIWEYTWNWNVLHILAFDVVFDFFEDSIPPNISNETAHLIEFRARAAIVLDHHSNMFVSDSFVCCLFYFDDSWPGRCAWILCHFCIISTFQRFSLNGMKNDWMKINVQKITTKPNQVRTWK